MRRSLSRLTAFLVLSALLIAGAALASGWLAGTFFERYLLGREEADTAEMVVNQARQHLAEDDFSAAPRPERDAAFQELLAGLPGVFRVKAFDADGRIVWSDEARLIGRAFPDNAVLAAALGGRVATSLGSPKRAEHVFERQREVVAEVYVPITLRAGGRQVGVLETYRDMTGVMRDLRLAQRTIWLMAGAIGLGLYLALAGVVWQASRRERQAMRALEVQNREISLVQQFARSMLRSADATQVIRKIVEDLGPRAGLSAAALYRLRDGGDPVLVAAWPQAPAPRPSGFGSSGPVDAASSARLVDGHLLRPMTVRGKLSHLFVGALAPGRPSPEPDGLRTLDILLDEAVIALRTIDLFEEIRQTNERLDAILASNADQMIILDRDMRVTWMNAAAAASAGADALGRPCVEVIGGGGDCTTCPAAKTLATGHVERAVRAQRTVDGRLAYLDIITTPIRDAGGAVGQVMEVARDVTELVEMEERLKGANQALVDAQTRLIEHERLAAVGQVVVGLHHGILNPLTGILGALHVLREASGDPVRRAEAITAAEEEARKIEGLVRQLAELRQTAERPYVGGITMLDIESSAAPAADSPPRPAADGGRDSGVAPA